MWVSSFYFGSGTGTGGTVIVDTVAIKSPVKKVLTIDTEDDIILKVNKEASTALDLDEKVLTNVRKKTVAEI